MVLTIQLLQFCYYNIIRIFINSSPNIYTRYTTKKKLQNVSQKRRKSIPLLNNIIHTYHTKEQKDKSHVSPPKVKEHRSHSAKNHSNRWVCLKVVCISNIASSKGKNKIYDTPEDFGMHSFQTSYIKKGQQKIRAW